MMLFCYAGTKDADGEGGCSSHADGCDGSTGTTFLPAAVDIFYDLYYIYYIAVDVSHDL